MMNNYCTSDYMAKLNAQLLKQSAVSSLCPQCDRGLGEFAAPGFDGKLLACRHCRYVWFLPGLETVFLRSSDGIKPEFKNVDPANFPKAFFGMPREDERSIWDGVGGIFLVIASLAAVIAVVLLAMR